MKKKVSFYYAIPAGFLLLLFIGSLAYGSVSIPAGEVFDILLGGESEKEAWRSIVMQETGRNFRRGKQNASRRNSTNPNQIR